ncbi:MAG: hypothetical protein ACLP0J_05355 [Solirubrobacteraceae bacterium]
MPPGDREQPSELGVHERQEDHDPRRDAPRNDRRRTAENGIKRSYHRATLLLSSYQLIGQLHYGERAIVLDEPHVIDTDTFDELTSSKVSKPVEAPSRSQNDCSRDWACCVAADATRA